MKYAFLITHYGSGGSVLCRILNENSRVCALGNAKLTYDHPTVLQQLRERWQKSRPYTEAYWYVDKLTMNHQFCCKNLYDICKFIYFIREPEGTMPAIVARGYTATNAANYYRFRLRRIAEMARRTPGGILLTYSDFVMEPTRTLKLLDEELGLRTPLAPHFLPGKEDDVNMRTGKVLKYPEESQAMVSNDILEGCDKAYRKYLSYLTQENLRLHF